MTHDTWRTAWEAARRGGPSQRPFVTAAFALSADGYLTRQRGRPTAVSCGDALAVTHAMRAAHDAILVGRGTMEADDPRLTTRFEAGRTGLRAVLDTRLSISPAARLITAQERPLVVFTSPGAPEERAQQLRSHRVEVERLPLNGRGLSLPEVLQALRARGVASVMVEGGAEVLDSFVLEGLVDFLCVTTSPQQLAGPEALGCGPVTRELLSRWRPQATFIAGDDTITAGATA